MSDIDGNAGPSRTCISWRERGSASDQLRRKKKQSVNRATLLRSELNGEARNETGR